MIKWSQRGLLGKSEKAKHRVEGSCIDVDSLVRGACLKT